MLPLTAQRAMRAIGLPAAAPSKYSTDRVASRAAPCGMSRVIPWQVLHTHDESAGPLASEVLVRRMLEGIGHKVPIAGSLVDALVRAVREDGLAPFLRFIERGREVFLALRSLAHGQSGCPRPGLHRPHRRTGRPGRGWRTSAVRSRRMTALVDAWLRDEHAPTPEEQAARLERYARAVFEAWL